MRIDIDLIHIQVPNKPQAGHSNYVANPFNIVEVFVLMLWKLKNLLK